MHSYEVIYTLIDFCGEACVINESWRIEIFIKLSVKNIAEESWNIINNIVRRNLEHNNLSGSLHCHKKTSPTSL